MKAVGAQSHKLNSLTKEAEVIAERFENQQADIDSKKMELEKKMEQMQMQDVELLSTQNQLSRVQQQVQERAGELSSLKELAEADTQRMREMERQAAELKAEAEARKLVADKMRVELNAALKERDQLQDRASRLEVEVEVMHPTPNLSTAFLYQFDTHIRCYASSARMHLSERSKHATGKLSC